MISHYPVEGKNMECEIAMSSTDRNKLKNVAKGFLKTDLQDWIKFFSNGFILSSGLFDNVTKTSVFLNTAQQFNIAREISSGETNVERSKKDGTGSKL